MAKTKSKRRSPQKNFSVPPANMKDIKEAMRLEGITNFSVYTLAAVLQHTARVRRRHALEQANELADVVPKLRALLVDIEGKK
jgi:hypothetical protein